MAEELQKAKIKPLKPDGEEIEVLFNPTEYRVSKSNQFAEVAIPGLEVPMLQFGHGNAQTLSMQLFFDTYDPQATSDDRRGKIQDVRDLTSKITNLLRVDGKSHAPPICRFSWDQFVFTGVLQQADVRFTLFLPNGRPVRATMDVTFKEFYDGIERTGILQSANFVKQHVVKAGDTLSGIAAELYHDPAKWRPIAERNNMDNPIELQPGRVLIIPAIE